MDPKRRAKRRSKWHLMEPLENRRLLSATLSYPSTQSTMVFNAVQNNTSQTESLALTDTGDATLNISSISIINDPNFSAQDASRFSITNAGSIPSSLTPGQSFTLQMTYKPNIIGIQSALLDMETNDGSQPSQQIALRGLGAVGLGGTNQPSLATILQAWEIPTYVGQGFDDNAATTDTTYPAFPDASSQEVVMPRLVEATNAPVTIQVLASYTASGTKPYTLGTYVPGNPNARSELFSTPSSEYQSTYIQPQGTTTFNPGSTPFGFYFVSNVKVDKVHNDIGYSEDQFNTWDTTPASQASNPQRKFRFFPMETPTGTIVPNEYIMTSTEWYNPGGYDFTNIVAIVSNVMPAPNVTATPVIGLQNLNPLPGSINLIFNRIQIPNSEIGNQFHNTNALQINNTGQAPLIISSATFSDSTNWTLVNPPTFPLTVAPGTNTSLTIRFIAQKEPPHPYNETNSTGNPNEGGLYSATLTINSNDPNTPAATATLKGWWQQQSEMDDEPSVQSLVNLIAGWSTDINPSPIPTLTESLNIPSTPVYYGEETVSAYWSIADSSQPVSINQLDSFHTQWDVDDPQGNIATFSWFAPGGSAHSVITTAHLYGQTLFPALYGTTTPAAALFTPSSSTFGFKVDGETSVDTLNPQNGGGGHHMRFFPVRSANGDLVPNTYLMFMDYSIIPGENFDFNDNGYVISNIHPATTASGITAPQTTAAPAAPTDLFATAVSNGALLQWAPAQGSIAGYNVYSSLAATSGFSLLTSSPITQTTYTDNSAPPGTTLFYRVTAVSSAGLESPGVESSTTTLGTPVTGLQSADVGATPAGSTTVVTPQTAFTIVAGGPGVTGNVDGFRFIFQQQTGDFDLKAQVSSLTVAGNFSTAGIMARSTLDTDSANVYMSASPVNYRFKDRATVGATAALVVGPATTFPDVWVRLSRVGNVFTGYNSIDGVNWTVTSTVTLNLPTTLYLGLAVASNVTNATTTAQINSFGASFPGPVTNPVAFSATTGQPTELDVLANDSDTGGTLDPTTVAIDTPPNQGGTATVDPNGEITYTSAAGYVGIETFTYTVSDSNAVTSSPTTVTVTVSAPGPVCSPYSFNAVSGKSIVVNLLANDTDTSGTILPGTVAIVTPPSAGGTATVDPTTGDVTYTPLAGFVGTETFTYDVQDTNGVTAQPATVTFTVTNNPLGPVANPDSAQAVSGQSTQFDVLQNDFDETGTVDPTTVAIAQAPNQGGTVQIDPTTGLITYTSAIGFVGTETFSYTVADNKMVVSQPAIVTVIVAAAGSSVTAANDSATTIVNTGVIIPVLTNDSAAGTLNPASVKVVTKPAHGAATVNSDGTVTFNPNTGFVGVDSFTYTVADTNSNTSNIATVSLDVGVEISSNPGADKTVTYTDASGATATIALTHGTADIFFTGAGAASSPKPGQVVVTGANRQLSSIDLTNTTAASALTIKSLPTTDVITLGDISDDGTLGRIIAPGANLTGTVSVGGVLALQLLSATGAQLQIGGGIPNGFSIVAGAVNGSSINSSVPIHSIKVTSWSSGGAIAAPSIGTLTVSGDFGAALNLSAATGLNLASAKITGSVSGDWTLAASAGTILVGSIAANAAVDATGNINCFNVHAGGLPASLTAAAVGSIFITGNLTGDLTLDSAKTIKIAGNIKGATLTFTPAAGVNALNQLLVSQAIEQSTLTASGNIQNITAASLTDSTIDVGADSAVTLATASSSTLGTNKLSAIQLKSTAGNAFSNSSILADAIGSASLGTINTVNGGTPEGLAAVTYKSLSASVHGVPFHAGAAQLTSASDLTTYLTSKGISSAAFGDFEIEIE